MENLTLEKRQLCDIQGRLFELALKAGLDCPLFIESFMNSKAAAALDDVYDRLQWAGEEYILEELDDEVCGLKKAGPTYSAEIMYWTGYTYRYPEEAFRVITVNKEAAIPYLREAVSYAISKGMDLDENYQLHFYALYLLGEFQDRASFSMIMKLVSLPGDTADRLIGDCVTENLKDILYNTYDGDIELLKRSIQDRNIDEYVRSAMLDVMGQLYLDGILEESEWKEFLKQNVHDGREYDYVYDAIGDVLCQCLFFDMLPEIRYMIDNDLIDGFSVGRYGSYVDDMFEYQEDENRFCKASIKAADTLRHWAMFSGSEDAESEEKEFDRMLSRMGKEWNKPVPKKKIGRNDPCPCGSGKNGKRTDFVLCRI